MKMINTYFGAIDLPIPTEPWDPENNEAENLSYHYSEMRTLENLLTTYQYCDCEKSDELIEAIKLVRNSITFKRA